MLSASEVTLQSVHTHDEVTIIITGLVAIGTIVGKLF